MFELKKIDWRAIEVTGISINPKIPSPCLALGSLPSLWMDGVELIFYEALHHECLFHECRRQGRAVKVQGLVPCTHQLWNASIK